MVSATAAATVAAARVDLSLPRVHSRPAIIINSKAICINRRGSNIGLTLANRPRRRLHINVALGQSLPVGKHCSLTERIHHVLCNLLRKHKCFPSIGSVLDLRPPENVGLIHLLVPIYSLVPINHITLIKNSILLQPLIPIHPLVPIQHLFPIHPLVLSLKGDM